MTQTSQLSFKGLEPFQVINLSTSSTSVKCPMPPATGANSPNAVMIRYSVQQVSQSYLQIAFLNAGNSIPPHQWVTSGSGSQGMNTGSSSTGYGARLTKWVSSAEPNVTIQGGSSAGGTSGWIYFMPIAQTSPNGMGVRQWFSFSTTLYNGGCNVHQGGGVVYNALSDTDHVTQFQLNASTGNIKNIYVEIYSMGQI